MVRALRPLVFLAVVGSVSLAAQRPPVNDSGRFRSGIELISITATVLDRDGRLIKDLPREAFDVYEDSELQTITQFTHERVPISLAVLLDVSDSMYGQRLVDARTAVERFLLELLDPEDEFLVLGFNHQPHILTQWTNMAATMQSALAGLRPSGATALYDAVLAALPFMENRARKRAALVLISDGADTASDATLRDVRSALLRSDAFAYAIAIDSTARRAINRQVSPSALSEITDPSGGRTEVVRDTTDLMAATSRIADELNSQYVLAYNSPRGSDGKFHSIRVRVRGLNYRVRARTGYIAGPTPIPAKD